MKNLHKIDSFIENHDVMVYAEDHTCAIDCTFDTKVCVERNDPHPGWRFTVLERIPIYVSYGDRMDRELEWRYGENMHPRIARALENLEAKISDEVQHRLEKILFFKAS